MEVALERIGVREPTEHASEIAHRVRDHHDMYGITDRGRAITRLVPITEPGTAQSSESFWAESRPRSRHGGRRKLRPARRWPSSGGNNERINPFAG